jgi:PAS domain S-box-containing protein
MQNLPCSFAETMADSKKTEAQLTAALKSSEKRYRLIHDTAFDAIISAGRDNRITGANPSAERIFGYEKGEMIGLTISDLIPEKYREHHNAGLQHFIDSGISRNMGHNLEFEGLRRNGDVFPIELAVNPLELDGEIYFSAIIRDISKHKWTENNLHKKIKELEQSEQLFNHLAENIGEVFWITAPDKNRMIYISPAYESIWGRSCKGLYASSRDWIEAIHADDRKRVLMAATTKQISGEYDEEYRIVRPDGAIRWIHDRAFPVRDESGPVCRIVGVARDITEIAQARLLDKLRQRLMEIILSTENGLGDVLNHMTLEVEKNIPEMLGSVLLMDEEGRHLLHGAAPSLPDAYNEAINGVEIGPCVGSCGTAAFRAERVIVSDIATDPLWENYKGLALSHGLAACWSEPIQDESGKVLGTFAMYYRKCRAPQPFELKIVELMSELVDIAIVRKRMESEQQQRTVRIAAELGAITALGHAIGREGCPIDMAMRHICESAANTIRVERASVWRLSNEGKELRCLNLFERTSGRHSSSPDTVLKADDYPAYFKTIKNNRVLAAHDARSNPGTREFRNGYLIPLDIHSMLDAAVRIEGKLFGIICLEHTEQPRRWYDDEISFAGELADQVAQALLSEKNRQASADLKLAASVFSENPMGIIITDEKAARQSGIHGYHGLFSRGSNWPESTHTEVGPTG